MGDRFTTITLTVSKKSWSPPPHASRWATKVTGELSKTESSGLAHWKREQLGGRHERRENRDFTSGCHKSNAPSPSSVNYHTSPVAREFKMKGRIISDVEGLKAPRRGSFE